MRALLGPPEGDLNTVQMTCRAVTVGAGGKKTPQKNSVLVREVIYWSLSDGCGF